MDGLKAFKRRLLVAVLLAASLTTLLVTFVRPISSAPESCRPLTGWKAEWAICIWQ